MAIGVAIATEGLELRPGDIWVASEEVGPRQLECEAALLRMEARAATPLAGWDGLHMIYLFRSRGRGPGRGLELLGSAASRSQSESARGSRSLACPLHGLRRQRCGGLDWRSGRCLGRLA